MNASVLSPSLPIENRGTKSEHEGVLPDNDLSENYKPQDYYGEAANNVRHGKGNCSASLGLHVHTNGIYDGVWKHNKAAGKGVAHYNNGDVYDGDWLDNKLHGKGILVQEVRKLLLRKRGQVHGGVHGGEDDRKR